MFNLNGTFNFEHTLANVGVALGIAFGDHGFGSNKFTEQRPFILIVVHQDNQNLEAQFAQVEIAVTAFVLDYKQKNSLNMSENIVVTAVNIEKT